MKTYRDYDIDAPDHGTGEHYTTCPQCSAQRKKSREKCLSVNLNKRTWYCHHCGFTGGLPPENSPLQAPPPKPARKPARPPPDIGPLSDNALAWLEKRGIPRKVAEAVKLGSCVRFFPKLNREADAIAIPFLKDGAAVNRKYRPLAGKDFMQDKGGQACLYGWDLAKGQGTIILTEGEVDAWSVCAAGYGAACSCPNGAPPAHAKNLDGKLAFIDDAADIFEHARAVIMAMDHDAAGVPWENAIADKIGRGKCWTCTYPDSCKDLNDVLVKHGPEAVRECIDNAKPVPVSGLTTFAEHAGEIREYFQDGGLSRGLSTGWKNLDELLRLRPGTVNVVTGIPSSGKSEWLDQLMLNAIRLHGWRWCMFSPENLPLPYHCQKLAEKLLCKPMFPRYSLPAMTTTDVEKAIRTLSASITFITLDERGLDLDGILSRARVCAVRDGIRGMILDPYNEIEHRRPAGMNESEYVSAFLSKVRTFARLYDVAVFVVAHPTKLQKMDSGEHKGDYPVPTPYDISGSANWRNKADVCIAAWRSYQADENTVQIHVQKVRDKNLGQTGMVELHWHRATGLFFVTEEDLREAVQASHAADERPAGCDDGEWC